MNKALWLLIFLFPASCLGANESKIEESLVLPFLTAGSVVFIGANGIVTEDNSELFWHVSNNALIIGTTTVAGSTTKFMILGGNFRVVSPRGESRMIFSGGQSDTEDADIRLFDNTDTLKVALDSNGPSSFLGGNVGIGISNPAYPVDVVHGISGGTASALHFNTDSVDDGGYIEAVEAGQFSFSGGAKYKATSVAFPSFQHTYTYEAKHTSAAGIITDDDMAFWAEDSLTVGVNFNTDPIMWINIEGTMTLGGNESTTQNTILNRTGAAVFNEQGDDVDFRIEGSGETNAFFVQGSDGMVGLGTGIPTAQLHTTKGRIVNTTRITGNTTLDATHHNVFSDTDGGSFIVTLPAGVDGTYYRIVNSGSSGNNLTVTPDGSELLLGLNSPVILKDRSSGRPSGDVLTIVYETTEGWY